ncbi:MAG: hypothetical protein ING36_06710 [Burkholderiales bacterium]|jgi:hypothetical protein|nr:hypothetical protein [Microcystis sp. M015S1]MCA3175221.1 hypothetical protein [Burkholderiales bacterium]
MSKQTRINRCKVLYEQFLALNPREFESWPLAMSDFDGLNFDEAKKSMRFVLYTMDGLSANDAWDELSWNAYNSIESVLQAVYNSYTPLKNSRDQNSFQNFVPQLDSLAYHLRMFGVASLATGGANLERTAAAVASELERLTSARTEVEKLRDEVKTLIAPAVAGSLSNAFTARKTVLLLGRIFWGLIALIVGYYCVDATYGFAAAVGDALIAAKQTASAPDVMWASVLLRSVVLIPLYVAFGFAFSQYKKERDFEEEYAHKAAVATSLPNYGDLTREPAVRDQIVTGATNVIFSAPTTRKAEPERSDRVLGSMRELIDSVAKLLPKKNDG